MLPRYTRHTLEAAERVAREGSIVSVYDELRALTLADFCSLHMGVPDVYPALKSVLPVLPDDDVQVRWTGDSGASLMRQIGRAHV